MVYGGDFAVSGSFDLYDNAADGKRSNVYLSEDTLITVAGELALSTPISVTTEATPTATVPVVLTDGLPGYAATSDFASENPEYEVQLNAAGEAILALPSPELLAPPAGKKLGYNGAAQTLIDAGRAANGVLKYKLSDDGEYAETLPEATDAGKYTIYYKVFGENGATDTSEQSLSVTIAPKPLTDMALQAASLVYSGDAQTNAVTVKDGNATLSAGTDYDVSGNVGTNVGTYTASVTGTGNYTGTIEKTWTITPAGISPSVTLSGWTYGDAANTPVIAGNLGNGAALIGYKPKGAEDEAYSSAVPLDAGEYVVRAQIAATDNYLAGEASANFTIAKRPATVTAAEQSVLEGGEIDASVTRAALSGAVSGHTLDSIVLTSTSTATPTDAGTITPSGAKIVKNGTDVTKNYDIAYVGGALTVEKIIRSYPLTFYADGAGETVSQQHDALSGSALSAYADLKLENDARRTFAGWSLEKNVTDYKDNEDKVIDWNNFTMPEEAVSVYPVWVENQLNIRLDLGAYDEQNTQSWYDASQYDPATPAYMEAVKNRNFWEKSGALITMDRINAATRPGYLLDGWRTQDGMLWDPSWKVEAQYCDRDSDGKVILLEDPEYRNFYYILTLTAKWAKEPKKASVFYDLNGGTGVIEDNATYIVNDLLTIVSETPTPPEGKLFAGWLDKVGNLYHPGDSSVFASEDWLSERGGEEGLWLTALYEDIPEPEYFTITFKTGGGSLVSPITLQPGEAVTPPADPTRIGYAFAGWDPKVPETMPDDDLTVTAQWTPNRYTITFDAGRGSSVTPITQDFGSPIAPPANPVLTGYSFAGWDPALPETMPAQDLTVQAVWTVNSYTISFDTDGGSVMEPLTNIYGAWIEAPENPTKDGYAFGGWDRAIPTTMPAENVTVKAQWKKITEVYAVKQNADGTWADAVSLDASSGDAYQVTELYRDEHLSASAYSLGAYADESGRTAISAGDSVSLSDADGKLYLYYARDAFDLTIYADVAGTKVLKTEKVLYGASLSEYAALTLDDTDLYAFAGWTPDKNVTTYLNGAGETANEIAWDGLTMSAEPLDVYPILVTNYINVKLDLGADDAMMDASQSRSFWKAADTGVLVDMALMNAATRPDYALDGWYTNDGTRWEASYPVSLEYCDRDADGNPIRAYDAPYKNYAYTLTLTAKWKIDVTANVVYDLNGGSGSVTDSASYPFNSAIKISESVPTPPDYQIFTGWLDSAGTLHNPGDSFDFSDMALRAVQDDENVIILTAQYMTPGNVTITFDTDGGNAIAPITGDAGTPVT